LSENPKVLENKSHVTKPNIFLKFYPMVRSMIY